jgi:hypothetical protein
VVAIFTYDIQTTITKQQPKIKRPDPQLKSKIQFSEDIQAELEPQTLASSKNFVYHKNKFLKA